MICSKFVQNPVIVQNIFRRLSLSTSDLRISSNLHNINTTTTNYTRHIHTAGALTSHCLLGEDCDRQVTGRRRRSYSTGHDPCASGGNASLTEMASEFQKPKSEAPQASSERKLNRLSQEKSPYLLQHATNPVDWFPWGEEAFEKARAENKLIFLSVGYSTCHWCHVMEKESFENDDVAKLLNRHFVNIKVDREERPDVDKLYMTFIQAMQGGGGWPMTVFLTPSLEPITGGTYFPPEDSYGRPGIKTLLTSVARQWQAQKATVLKSGAHILKVLKAATEVDACQTIDVPDASCWFTLYKQLAKSYEPDCGGFTRAPKFPQPSNFNFLFHLYSTDKSSDRGRQCLDMALHSLKKMAYGGIHDHVNCGFARYSVDKKWHVPHFEKMLYDQAQLVISYLDAYVVTKDEFYAEIVHDILKYVDRDLGHSEGGFYGAEDADSFPDFGAAHKQEGAFCVWEYSELCSLLSQQTLPGIPDYEIFNAHYNVAEAGNVDPSQDPHGELVNKNVLACFASYEDTASKFEQASVQQVRQVLDACHRILYAERQKRPKPHVDTKIVASWNGLMISGFAKAGFILKDQRYINRAVLAANFIKKYLYDEKDNTLIRCCYKADDGQIVYSSVRIPAFIDDYAFLIRGLLDLYESSLDAEWLLLAETLQEQQDRLFWDDDGAGYFTSPEGDSSILIRGKEDQDGAEPCGNSIAVHNLIRLSAYLDRHDLRAKAGRTLTAFSEKLQKIPLALPEMTSALMFYHQSPTQVFICGKAEEERTQALLDVIRARLLPGRMVAVADGPHGRSGLLYTRHETLARLKPVRGKPAAYVCRNFACSLPVTEPFDLAASLDKENSKDDKANDPMGCMARKHGESSKSTKTKKEGDDSD